MEWKKLGQIYCPLEDDIYTHAMFPVVDIVDESRGLIRVYFTHRDKTNYGFPAFLNGVIENQVLKVLDVHSQPLISKALPGNFDDSGVNVTAIVKDHGRKLFYYYGWNLAVTVLMRNSIGLAELSADGVSLERRFLGPIIDRSKSFPGFCATPFVLKQGEKFRMWFADSDPWILGLGKPAVACHIGYAESEDGCNWLREVPPSVASSDSHHVISTPCVVADDDVYRMWYSYRGEKYRIGYGESLDGRVFTRKDDEVGLTVSEVGWDSEMVCYPHVFDLQGTRYMLYCGNDYGRTGFGLAVLRQ